MSSNGENSVDNDKPFKICNVLGGLDITRFVSSNTRSFFRGAIEDVELIREFVSTAAERQGIVGGISTLAELNQTLDWEIRNFSSPTTTVEAGLGYVDDRIDRTIERYVSYANAPLVGDKETDLAIVNAVSLIFPWIVDRKSNEKSWWLTHQNGRSEGFSHEPFLFESLYTAAFIGTYGEAWAYYPPLWVSEHPFTFADLLTSDYDSHEEEFVKPNLPPNNPERKSFFSQPYADTAVPGLSLITALAPVYFTGTFGDVVFDDTYLASAGLDISVSSVSTLLDELDGTLTERSFGILVDSNFNTIVISQASVEKLYPERTGFEDSRVTYDLNNGKIVIDRRNQTYLVSDTILEPLTELKNADWNSLLTSVNEVTLGDRGFTTLNVTVTGDTSPTEYYVMFERWQYVADWEVLVFAPISETDYAIDVQIRGDLNTGDERSISLEAEKGSTVTGSSLIVNSGTLDISISAKTHPKWVRLATTSEELLLIPAGESLPIEFDVLTDDLDFGTTSGVMTFTIQDDQYPDCFYNEALNLIVIMHTTSQDCGSARIANSDNDCVCSSDSVPIGGNCVLLSVLLPSIIVPLVLVALFALYVYVERKRKQADSVWAVKPSELHFLDPPEVIGRGTFGLVLAAEYRGTRVAVKRVLPPKSQGHGDGRSSVCKMPFDLRSSADHIKIGSIDTSVGPLTVGTHKALVNATSPEDSSIRVGKNTSDDRTSRRPSSEGAPRRQAKRKSEIRTQIFDFKNVKSVIIPLDSELIKQGSLPSGLTQQESVAHGTSEGAPRGINKKANGRKSGAQMFGIDNNIKPIRRKVEAQLVGVDGNVATTAVHTSSTVELPRSRSSLEIVIDVHVAETGSMTVPSAKVGRSIWKRRGGYGDNHAKLRADFIDEMRLLSKLRHPCITTVMGAVIAAKEEPMLIMEYMDHGSLYDVLHNETMVIEGELVLPILRDIANGLLFLHKAVPQVVHGDLKAQNVLVDIKFRAKVADFGLSQKKKVGATGTPYWMAPELLRGDSANTADSDVYSFGIILYEVYSRKEPYEDEDFKKVLREICDPAINRRPPVPRSMPPAIVSLMCDCLVADPKSRPTFDEIDNRMKRLSVENIEPGRTKSSKSSVKELEAQKNEDLLLKVFPKHIAEALREGRKVEPEHYDCVTIFFSDIVGFTAISGSTTPMKIADMLDRLYLAFDWLSDEHGVFKIETIGDAWVGVTNLVEDQPDHAERVARFAMDAIDVAGRTSIDLDDPEKGTVQIRVGFHSGPVLSNVVGSRNPKFSIFGDTVNTASRMESNSSAGLILCSESSAEILTGRNADLSVEFRGDIDVKGKGEMKTYWVGAPK